VSPAASSTRDAGGRNAASRVGSVAPFEIRPADAAVHAAALRYLDDLTKPRGSLGRLERLAARLCAMQRTLEPRVDAPATLVFAADHGIAHEGVSAYPRAVTAQMVANFLSGGAAISVLARSQRMSLTIVDVGVDADLAQHAALLSRKMARGTGNVCEQAAMTPAQLAAAIAAGADAASQAISHGANVLLLGEMGIGNTAIGALLLHQLSDWPLEQCVGRGTGIDDAQLARKHALLTRAALRTRGAGIAAGDATNALDYLSECGGFEYAALVGAILATAERQVPVLIDGFAVTVAAAYARALAPAVLDYCVFAHVSAEHAHRALLAHLDADPLLDLQLRLGEASGAALALPLVQASATLLTDMATFSGAGVSR
jgi:nicotinate-nucleotide--dimethylbenzimidazole phosphoribosyltransferase